MKLSRHARLHTTAGVDADLWVDFPVGTRVMTPEGFPGTVTEVLDGPHAGNEDYTVELDGGMGGGTYGSSELSALATNLGPVSSSLVVEADDACSACGGTGEQGNGHECYICDGSGSAVEEASGRAAGIDNSNPENGLPVGIDLATASVELRVASEDYPELETILVERPPLEHAVISSLDADRNGGLWSGPEGLGRAGTEAARLYERGNPKCNNCNINDAVTSTTVDGHRTDLCMSCSRDFGLDPSEKFEQDFSKSAVLSGEVEALAADQDMTLATDVEVEFSGKTWRGQIGGFSDTSLTLYLREGEGFNGQQQMALDAIDSIRRTGSKLAGYEDLAEEPWLHIKDKDEDEKKPIDYGVCDTCGGTGDYEESGGTRVTCPNCRGTGHYARLVEAGPLTWAEDRWADSVNKKTNPEFQNLDWSYDWCRFRKDKHCMFSTHLDEEASEQAGYAVWIPENRGVCPRDKWDDQKACPIGEPGPHSGDPHARIDATTPWEQGGQRGGVPERGLTASLQELIASRSFEFTASWTDVRAKAKRIRSAGGVRIIAKPGQSGSLYITAEVQGDTNIYQTTLMREPGKKSIASWECGCAWSAYSWGRSGRWKRYEGRMCSHALALAYEAQAQEMFGGEIQEQPNKAPWQLDPTIPVKVPGDYEKKNPNGEWRVGSVEAQGPAPHQPDWTGFEVSPGECFLNAGDAADWLGSDYRYVEGHAKSPESDEWTPHAWVVGPEGIVDPTWQDTGPGFLYREDDPHSATASTGPFGFRPVWTDPELHDPPILGVAKDMLSEGADPNVVMGYLIENGVAAAPSLMTLALRRTAFQAKTPTGVVDIVKLLGNGVALTDRGDEVPVSHLLYPTYDPSLGLHLGSLVVAEANHTGVMVALVPPPDVVKPLLIEGGEPLEDAHITLAYIGKSDDVDEGALHRAVAKFVELATPLTGNIQGYGVFHNDQQTLYASWNIPGISEFRVELVKMLASEGLSVSTDYDFIPHETLLYSDDPIEVPTELPEEATRSVTFTSVIAAYGGEWYEYGFDFVRLMDRAAAFGDDPRERKALEDFADALTRPGKDKHDYGSGLMGPVEYGGYISQDRQGNLRLDGKQVEKLYRVVDPLEWEEAQRNGYLQSRGGYTRASAQPNKQYALQGDMGIEGREGLVLEIDYDPADKWSASAEGYASTHNQIALSKVRQINHPRWASKQAALSGASISAFLRRAGFNPVGSGASRMREGLRVSNSYNGDVAVAADLDSESAAARMSEDAESALVEAGFTTRRISSNIFYVENAKTAAGFSTNKDHLLVLGEVESKLATPDESQDWDWSEEARDQWDQEATAELHDPEEPALPSTTADDEEDIKPGSPRLAWLMEGTPKSGDTSNAEIAQAAQQFLAKTSGKTFTPAEQSQIINEGEGVTAGNLDLLQIAGTHYQPLEDALLAQENDEGWLW